MSNKHARRRRQSALRASESAQPGPSQPAGPAPVRHTLRTTCLRFSHEMGVGVAAIVAHFTMMHSPAVLAVLVLIGAVAIWIENAGGAA